MADAAFDHASVQDTRCPGCGRDASSIPAADLPASLMEAGRRWRDFIVAVTDHPGGVDALSVRPSPDTWAAIEYACHVRDGLALTTRRVELTLLTYRPDHVGWDHEQAAIDGYYLAQDPAAVADDLGHGAAELAALIQPLHADAWRRPATGGGAEFTVAGLVRIAWHEAAHHLDDARASVPAPSL